MQRILRWNLYVAVSLLVGGIRTTRIVRAQPPPPCLVCLDGSSPLDIMMDPNVFGSGVSCTSFASEGAFVNANSEECRVLQLTALQGNCCPSSSFSLSSICSLCPDGWTNITYPDRLVSVPLPTSENTNSSKVVTCAALLQDDEIQKELLVAFQGAPGVCDATALRQSASYCGCTNVDTTCDLCNGQELLMDQEFTLTYATCPFLAYQVSIQPEGQCQLPDLEGFDVAALCCANVEPPDQCTICSPDAELIPSRNVSTISYGEVTCGDVQVAASLATNSGTCRSLLKEVGRRCCLEIPNPDACMLRCPDGSVPPDPFKLDPVTGHTCQSLASEYSAIAQADCDDAATLLGFDAVAFCCPMVEPPDQCSVCPPGEALLFPERVLFAYDDHSCATVTESLRYVVGRACQEIIDESRANRNCKCRTDALPSPPSVVFPDDVTDRTSTGSATILRWLGSIHWTFSLLTLLVASGHG